jgi:hypothetical protein
MAPTEAERRFLQLGVRGATVLGFSLLDPGSWMRSSDQPEQQASDDHPYHAEI